MSNATAHATDDVGPLTLVPLLVSIGTLILVVVMMCYVYYHREVRRSVQFSNQLHVTEERIENLEARKVKKLALRKLQPAEKRGSVTELDDLRPVTPQRAGNLGASKSGSKRLSETGVEEVDRHVAATELQEDFDTSTVAECGTAYSQVGSLRDETGAGGVLDRWRRQRQGATVTPLLVTAMAAQSTVRHGEIRKSRVETSPPTEQDAAHAVATKEATLSGKVATTSFLTDTQEKWV